MFSQLDWLLILAATVALATGCTAIFFFLLRREEREEQFGMGQSRE
jgi:flagellar basal body-associated protein FliL